MTPQKNGVEPLTHETLSRAFTTHDNAPRLCVFGEIDSTNNEAKRMCASGEKSPTLIVAESQTAGRGRLGRSFYSPAESGVYFSILFPSLAPLKSAVSVTGAAAVAVMRAIRTLTGKQTAIKWVNDLYLDGKKVCGILAEAVSVQDGIQHLVVGIGINLSTSVFPAELHDKAGSLGATVPRAALIAAVWRELRPFLLDPDSREWLDDYRAHSCVIGKPIVWSCGSETHEGIALGINDNGELLVQSPDSPPETLRTGEISVKMI